MVMTVPVRAAKVVQVSQIERFDESRNARVAEDGGGRKKTRRWMKKDDKVEGTRFYAQHATSMDIAVAESPSRFLSRLRGYLHPSWCSDKFKKWNAAGKANPAEAITALKKVKLSLRRVVV
ncbi:hypothetical protein PDIDSM_8520 [Penicillium digitatum]|nr:hypothetical protein PDIDSM_8520 [Penicillium digitatum]